MQRVSPFRALRYGDAAGDAAGLIAPPYDVIDPGLAKELRARSPYNAVRLVLPEGEGDRRYHVAAARLADWRREGVLVEDERPSLYVYRQRYERGGRPVDRLAVFGALRLDPPGEGVLPHEHTHAGPKADRLALTLATRTQLSPVFLVARDPGGSLLQALRVAASAGPARRAVTPDGVQHALWPVAASDATAGLAELTGRHPLLIADGHHRYETALEVQRQLRSESSGRVLACIVSEADPGLLIRPTHRTLRGRGRSTSGVPSAFDERLERLAEWFEVDELGPHAPADAERRAAEDPACMVVFPGGGEEGGRRPAYRLSPRHAGPPAPGEEGGNGDRATSRIAAVGFDRHVVRDLLGTDADSAARGGLLEYHRNAEEAVRRAGPGGGAFILPPVPLEAVWDVTAAGLRLPPKSTCFEPKIPSGLLFRPL